MAHRARQKRRPILRRAEEGTLEIDIGQRTMRPREARVEFDSAAEHRFRLRQAGGRESPKVPEAALVKIPGIDRAGWPADSRLALQPRQLGLDGRSDLLGDRI